MLMNDISPNGYTYSAMIEGCSRADQPESATLYLENMLCGGVVVFKFLYCLCATHFAGAHMTWIFLLRFVQQLKQFSIFFLTTLPCTCRNDTNHKTVC